LISDDLLVLAEEFSQWEDSCRRVDLLAVDRNGELVVIELKRSEDGGHMDLQSLRYAVMISTMTFQ
jgi:RecB family endonuclease NucS